MIVIGRTQGKFYTGLWPNVIIKHRLIDKLVVPAESTAPPPGVMPMQSLLWATCGRDTCTATLRHAVFNAKSVDSLALTACQLAPRAILFLVMENVATMICSYQWHWMKLQHGWWLMVVNNRSWRDVESPWCTVYGHGVLMVDVCVDSACKMKASIGQAHSVLLSA